MDRLPELRHSIFALTPSNLLIFGMLLCSLLRPMSDERCSSIGDL